MYSAGKCTSYWKGLPTRTLAFEKETYMPGHESSKECFTVRNQANASGNHKMKHIVACRPGRKVLYSIHIKLGTIKVVCLTTVCLNETYSKVP